MTKISPNLRTHSRNCKLLGRKFPDVFPITTLLSLPSEVLTIFLTHLSTADLINFTNTCSRLRSLRTAKTCTTIMAYQRYRREDQENLLSSPSPDRPNAIVHLFSLLQTSLKPAKHLFLRRKRKASAD